MAVSGIILFNVGTYAALQTIPAVRSVMILALAPMVILLLSRMLTPSHLTWRQILGVVISFVGISVVEIRTGSSAFLSLTSAGTGDLWMISAMFGFSLNTVLVRRLSPNISIIVAYGIAVLGGVIGLVAGYLFAPERYSASIADNTVCLAIVFLAVGPSVIAYLCWFYAIRVLGPHRVGNCILLVPLFGVILGNLLLSEKFTPTLAVGGGMVLGGVLLSFATPSRKEKEDGMSMGASIVQPVQGLRPTYNALRDGGSV